MVKDMTQGNPFKLIISFSLPLMIGHVFQSLYSTVDTIVVGRCIGVDALAAVGSTGPLSNLILGLVLGICAGFTVPIAQFFGAGDLHQMRRYVANSIYLGAFITLLFTAATTIFTRQLLDMMNTPADIMEGAYDYISVYFGGMFTMVLYNLLSGFIRALGDSKTPLLFLVVSSATNIILDLVFVLVFDMGVAGAAWATVFSQGISGVLCIWIIVKRIPQLHLTREELAPDFGMMKQLLLNGVPMGLQNSITSIGGALVQSAVNSLGSIIVASITTATNVQNLLIGPMSTLGSTASIYCGQNLGAKRFDRIRLGIRQFMLIMAVFGGISMLVMNLFGTRIALLFIDSTETAVLEYVRTFLFIHSFFYIPVGMLFIFRSSLQGMGYAVVAMFGSVFELVARTCVAFFLVRPFGFIGACASLPMAWCSALLLVIPMYFYQIRRMEKQQA